MEIGTVNLTKFATQITTQDTTMKTTQYTGTQGTLL